MNYYYMTVFLVMTVCSTMRGAEEAKTQLMGQLQNPYSKQWLDKILAISAEQEMKRMQEEEKVPSTQKKQLQVAIMKEQNNILFDSFNSCYHLPRRSGGGQKLTVQQAS